MPDGDARPRPSLPFAGLGVPTQPDAQAVLVEPGPDMPGGGEPWLDAGLAMAEAIADVPFDAAEGLDAAAPSPADTAIADAVLASFDQAADAHPGGSQGERGSEAGQGRAAPFDGAAIAFGERLLQTAAPEALAATDAVQAAADEAAEGGVDRQIVQAMRVQWRGGLGEATITLRPEYLGQVRISLRLEGGALQAHLQVEDPHVRAWVESHADLLKGGLAGQGLDLERLVVSDQPDSARRETPDEDRTRRGRRPRPGSSAEALGGPRFEVEA
jgi:flagellar hook-length control protein FliK